MSGDMLVVWNLDRLGRSLPHWIATIRTLDERVGGFKSLHERLATTGDEFGVFAEFERDRLRQHTNAGLTAARARGRKARSGMSLHTFFSAWDGQANVYVARTTAQRRIPAASVYRWIGPGDP